MEALEDRIARRMRQARETIHLLQQLHHPPTRTDAIRVHELHAQHEREAGREEAAEQAEQRAARTRRAG